MVEERVGKSLLSANITNDQSILEMSNVCHNGYVQVSAEVDYDFFEPPRADKVRRAGDPKYMSTFTNGLINKYKSRILAVFAQIDEPIRHFRLPCFDEGLIHRMATHGPEGDYNMPSYVESDIKAVSRKHIRVLTVRSMLDGAQYPLSYVFCPTDESTKQAAKNLLSHLSVGPATPWLTEVLPHTGKNKLYFPEVLNQLPPFLYEYTVGRSAAQSHRTVYDLVDFLRDPKTYWAKTSPCLGFQGSFMKFEQLYGMTIIRMKNTPKILLRYMSAQLTTQMYLYEFKSGGLVFPWATPENLDFLAAVSTHNTDLADVTLPVGFTFKKASQLNNLIKYSRFSLDGQLEYIQEGRDEAAQKELKQLLDQPFVRSLKDWAMELSCPLSVQPDPRYQPLFSLPPDMQYVQGQLSYLLKSVSNPLRQLAVTLRGFYLPIVRALPQLVSKSGVPLMCDDPDREYYFGLDYFPLRYESREEKEKKPKRPLRSRKQQPVNSDAEDLFKRWPENLTKTTRGHQTVEGQLMLGRIVLDNPTSISTLKFWREYNSNPDMFDARYGISVISETLDENYAQMMRQYSQRLYGRKLHQEKRKRGTKGAEGDDPSDADESDDETPSKKSRPTYAAKVKQEQGATSGQQRPASATQQRPPSRASGQAQTKSKGKKKAQTTQPARERPPKSSKKKEDEDHDSDVIPVDL